MPFYAVARGRKPGIYPTWNDCNEQVHGFDNARYKKFKTASEAQQFIDQKSSTTSNSSTPYQRNLKRKFSGSGSKDKAQALAKVARIEVDASTTVGKLL
jgi:viroplasmin and RNaseH domain-containing protein